MDSKGQAKHNEAEPFITLPICVKVTMPRVLPKFAAWYFCVSLTARAIESYLKIRLGARVRSANTASLCAMCQSKDSHKTSLVTLGSGVVP